MKKKILRIELKITVVGVFLESLTLIITIEMKKLGAWYQVFYISIMKKWYS